jgi:signal transduction histidine kinase
MIFAPCHGAGAGFDVQGAKKKGGLGLPSMQERIRLVHGRLSVESTGRAIHLTRRLRSLGNVADHSLDAYSGH